MSQRSQIVTAVAELTRALQTAGNVLATLAASSSELPAMRVFADTSGATLVANPLKHLPVRWSDIRSDWPKIGGRQFQRLPPDIFLRPAYRDACRFTRLRTCYVGECEGIQALSQRFCVPLGKVSTCGGGRLAERLKELSQERYGASIIFNGHEVVEDGYDRWSVIRPPKGLKVALNSPVEVKDRSLVVKIPHTLADRQFDIRYDELVRLGSLNNWLQTDAGLIHCQKVRADRQYGCRYTSRDYDGASQCEAAQEIVAFRCRSDFARLVQIVEFVIAEHVGLIG